jgi:hypothetical protein
MNYSNPPIPQLFNPTHSIQVPMDISRVLIVDIQSPVTSRPNPFGLDNFAPVYADFTSTSSNMFADSLSPYGEPRSRRQVSVVIISVGVALSTTPSVPKEFSLTFIIKGPSITRIPFCETRTRWLYVHRAELNAAIFGTADDLRASIPGLLWMQWWSV